MPRLAAGRWLSDNIIDFILRGIILPNLSEKHIYSTHFYSKLTGDNDAEGQAGYTFAEVQTWARRIQGGILNLEELYIPVNKNSNHWMVVRVNFPEKRVEAWDSLGPTEDAHNCLETSSDTYMTPWSTREPMYPRFQDGPRTGHAPTSQDDPHDKRMEQTAACSPSSRQLC